jgi:hypothetical protein
MGIASLSLDCRVVAKRKDDTGGRMEVVNEPAAMALGQKPQLPTLPPAPPARKRRG